MDNSCLSTHTETVYNLYIHREPDSATECGVLGASLVPLSTPFALFSIWFPFGGLPNRGASLVPLSTPSFCGPNRGASWYQDLGTKIYGEPERRSLSVCRGARGAAGPLPGGLSAGSPPVRTILWTQSQDQIPEHIFHPYS